VTRARRREQRHARGRRENRRIEIILLPDLSELTILPEDMAQAGPPTTGVPPDEEVGRSENRERSQPFVRSHD